MVKLEMKVGFGVQLGFMDSVLPRFGWISIFLLDFVMLVLLWRITSRESPIIDLQMEHSVRTIGSAAAISEICSYRVRNNIIIIFYYGYKF